jgi:TRAP-type transport system small permease protein
MIQEQARKDKGKIFHDFATNLSRFTGWLSNLGQAVLMIMVLLVVADVIMRRVFNQPLAWSKEMVQLILVVVIFFSIAYCGVVKSHITVDVFSRYFSSRVSAVLESITCFFGIALFAFMTWAGVTNSISNYHKHYISGLLPAPMYPFNAVVSFGGLLLTLVLVVQFVNSIVKAGRK